MIHRASVTVPSSVNRLRSRKLRQRLGDMQHGELVEVLPTGRVARVHGRRSRQAPWLTLTRGRLDRKELDREVGRSPASMFERRVLAEPRGGRSEHAPASAPETELGAVACRRLPVMHDKAIVALAGLQLGATMRLAASAAHHLMPGADPGPAVHTSQGRKSLLASTTSRRGQASHRVRAGASVGTCAREEDVVRFSFTSPMPCVGFALNHGREGDTPVVDASRFVSSEDGILLVSRLEAISGTLLAMSRALLNLGGGSEDQ